MRLSADPKSPFHRLPLARTARVFFDGQEQKHVLELDTAEGWIIRAVLGPDGKLISHDCGGGFLVEKVHGTVMLVQPNRPATEAGRL